MNNIDNTTKNNNKDECNNNKAIIIIMTVIITGLMPAGDSLISWGERSSLALVGNPSRDGVRAPQTHPSVYE